MYFINCFLSYFHCVELLASVLWTKRHMHPVVVVFVDELVEGEFQFDNQIEEFLVFFWRVLFSPDVSSLSEHVLTAGGTANGFVQVGAPIAAGDDDGFAVCLTQRIKNVFCQSHQPGTGTVAGVLSIPLRVAVGDFVDSLIVKYFISYLLS